MPGILIHALGVAAAAASLHVTFFYLVVIFALLATESSSGDQHSSLDALATAATPTASAPIAPPAVARHAIYRTNKRSALFLLRQHWTFLAAKGRQCDHTPGAVMLTAAAGLGAPTPLGPSTHGAIDGARVPAAGLRFFNDAGTPGATVHRRRGNRAGLGGNP